MSATQADVVRSEAGRRREEKKAGVSIDKEHSAFLSLSPTLFANIQICNWPVSANTNNAATGVDKIDNREQELQADRPQPHPMAPLSSGRFAGLIGGRIP